MAKKPKKSQVYQDNLAILQDSYFNYEDASTGKEIVLPMASVLLVGSVGYGRTLIVFRDGSVAISSTAYEELSEDMAAYQEASAAFQLLTVTHTKLVVIGGEPPPGPVEGKTPVGLKTKYVH